MSDELDELINDADEQIAESEETAETPPAETPTEDTEPQDDDSVKGETAEETPSSSDPDKPEPWAYAAWKDEREKRQAAEQRLAELEANREPAPKPDPVEDPEAAFAFAEQQRAEELWQLKVELTRDAMIDRHPDYAEREAAFAELATANPQLAADMYAAPNPARFAYETAVKHAEYQALQNVDEAKARMRAEIEAELRAEMERKGAENEQRGRTQAAAADLPSLATETGASGGGTVGDDDLNSVVLGDSL